MRSFLLVLALVAAGCSVMDGQATIRATPPETLAEARALWQQRGFSAYQVQYGRLCFCAPRKLEATLTVRDGAVVAFSDLRGNGQPLDAEHYEITVEDFPTVAALFDAIEQADPAFREVTYDAARGYPVEARLGDFSLDGGIEHTLRDLTPLR